jgi:hypothetical protein
MQAGPQHDDAYGVDRLRHGLLPELLPKVCAYSAPIHKRLPFSTSSSASPLCELGGRKLFTLDRLRYNMPHILQYFCPETLKSLAPRGMKHGVGFFTVELFHPLLLETKPETHF